MNAAVNEAPRDRLPDEILRDLEQVLGPGRVHTDADSRETFSTDLYSRGALCAAVIRPADRESLGTAVRLLTQAGLGLVPRGGGLTYTGGYTPAEAGAVGVDLRDLNRIVAVSEEDMYLVVEAGCTWRQIHEALAPRGLRLPCFGTFSGARATVGGGIANGALFFGTARYGTIADGLLGLEVVLAEGTRVRTGQGGFRNVTRPAYRTYGPDLTGLFVHDSGALGIKVEATFRLIRTPAATGFASFLFPTPDATIAAFSEIARAGLAEDLYVFDPESTRKSLSEVDMREGLRTLGKMVGQAGLFQGLKAGVRAATSARSIAESDAFSLHVTCAAASAAALEQELAAVRAIAARTGGAEVPDVVPRAARANLFPPVNAVLSPDGARWVALNAKVPHSEAMDLWRAAEAVLAPYRERMASARVSVRRLLTAVSNHSFSYEPVFHWYDEWLPAHRLNPEPDYLAKLTRPAPSPEARALVAEMRDKLVRLFAERGAASNQIGRTYAYLESLRPESRELLMSIKKLVDPQGRLNPGALGMS